TPKERVPTTKPKHKLQPEPNTGPNYRLAQHWPNLHKRDNTLVRVAPNAKTKTRVSGTSTIFTAGNVVTGPNQIS
ncbi:unnamed protein product, partial [Brassica napus]